MIQFDFDWSDPMNQLILILTFALFIVQLWLLVFRNGQNFNGRLGIRLGLNILLWLVVAAFILQPYIKKDSSSGIGMIAGKEVPSAFTKKLADSLKIAEILDFASLQDLQSLSRIDTLILAGQDFEPVFFETFMQAEHRPKVIKWISYFGPDQIQNLDWKGILRKGEMQNIHGNVESTKKQILKLRYGNQTLDSILLEPGLSHFKLSFPVFTQGRTSTELVLDNKSLNTIKFFARPTEPLTFQFILDNPDFESRSLATWLGKNGHSVLYTTKLSKDIQSQLTINKAKDPDVIITDPGNASNALIKKILANGKSVLFINLTNPTSEIPGVNSTLGTKLQIRKISNETTVSISPELTALPYNFTSSNYYLTTKGYPVAVEKTKGKVGVSLLNETFPLMLTGDSITYQKVWNSILTSIHPVAKSNVDVRAPVFKDFKTRIDLNNFSNASKQLIMKNDTLFQDYSALNNLTASVNFNPLETGWITLPDSLKSEIYVENTVEFNAIFNAKKVKNFVDLYTSYQTKLNEAMISPNAVLDRGIKKKFSDWIWFGLVMFCLLGVWVEGKL